MKLFKARADARERFASLVSEPRIELDRAAIWLAVEERPTPWPERPLDELERLAVGVQMPTRTTLYEAIARLNLHLFERLGFHGDRSDYYAPRNSCLDQVLRRRCGLPISLAVVYMEVARRCGVDMVGIGFPGHFIVAPAESEAPFFVDVFDGGAILRPHHLRALARARTGAHDEGAFARWTAPVDNRRILARICMNLKNAWLRAGNLEGALRASERLILLYPQRLREHQERAMLLAQLGRPRERALVTWSPSGSVGES